MLGKEKNSQGQSGVLADFAENHGEVSDPDQDKGERSLAHDQPLLPGCEGARAVFGTEALGKGFGGPASLSRPPRGFLHTGFWSWIRPELQDCPQARCATPAIWKQPSSQQGR